MAFKRKAPPSDTGLNLTEQELEFILQGGKSVAETQLELKKEKEKTIAVGFDLPVSVNNAIEEDRSGRYRKISKNQWILDAILKKLKWKVK